MNTLNTHSFYYPTRLRTEKMFHYCDNILKFLFITFERERERESEAERGLSLSCSQ